MTKLIATVRKLPQANTAPCFLASARVVAVEQTEHCLRKEIVVRGCAKDILEAAPM
jgi:hypothetical protein